MTEPLTNNNGAGRGGPRRGYSWPPFEPGNQVAQTHGAHSPRAVAAQRDQVLAEVAPWLEIYDRGAVSAWAAAEGVCRMLRAWLSQHGHLDEKGLPRPASALLLSWERRASHERARLGLDPLARAQLGRDVAIARNVQANTVARLVEDGRATIRHDDTGTT